MSPRGLRTYLHESLKLEELAMQIFKVLFEKVPEPVVKHDLDQHTERLLLWHLKKKTKRFSNKYLMPMYILMFLNEANTAFALLFSFPI